MRCLALTTCQLVSKILVAMFANFLEVLGQGHGEVCVSIEWTHKSTSVWSLVLDMKKLSLVGIEELEPGKRSLDHWGSPTEGGKGVLLGPLAELSGASLIPPLLQLPIHVWSFAPIQAPTAVTSVVRSSLEATSKELKDWLWAVRKKIKLLFFLKHPPSCFLPQWCKTVSNLKYRLIADNLDGLSYHLHPLNDVAPLPLFQPHWLCFSPVIVHGAKPFLEQGVLTGMGSPAWI